MYLLFLLHLLWFSTHSSFFFFSLAFLLALLISKFSYIFLLKESFNFFQKIIKIEFFSKKVFNFEEMQDPTTYHQQIKPQLQPQQQQQPQFQEQEHLKCPRCDSSNTKFCYYNNYNLSQPRHFCKNCRRYWTKGGALRNIPVGGGTRKHTKKSSTPKRISSSTPPPPAAAAANSANSVSTVQFSKPVVSNGGGINGIGFFSPLNHQMLDISAGSFSSLLASNVPFGNLLLDGLNVNPNTNNQSNGGSIKEVHQFGEFMVENSENLSHNNNQHLHTTLELQSDTNGGGGGGGANSESLLNGDWGSGGGRNVWPDLAIYTPGSNFQ